MYTTCIYCKRGLGTNQVIEHFPVGRRLAFDGEKGRLWAICERCRRWNLSPLEERWEALEECELAFRETPLRYSTDNIGLARHPEGLELVRVGRPVRREFAAWRYGRELLRRRTRSLIKMGALAVAWGVSAVSGIYVAMLLGDPKRIHARVRASDGRRLTVVRGDLKRVRLSLPDGPGDHWGLEIPHRPEEKGWFRARAGGRRQTAILRGEAAGDAADLILPGINSRGAWRYQVDGAVELIDRAGHPAGFFDSLSDVTGPVRRRDEAAPRIKKLPAEVRLALEMAAHEETERRALEGELAVLEAAWEEAEEIAAIADRLLIPERIERFVERFRRDEGTTADQESTS